MRSLSAACCSSRFRVGLSHGPFVYAAILASPSVVVVPLWGCGATPRRVE